MARKTVYRGRHVTVEFELNRRGIARCAVGPELKAACHGVVETRALPYAVSISPRSSRRHQHYQDSFRVDDDTWTPKARMPDWHMRRVVTRLVNTSPQAILVEVGPEQGNDRGFHVLGKTLAFLAATGK